MLPIRITTVETPTFYILLSIEVNAFDIKTDMTL